MNKLTYRFISLCLMLAFTLVLFCACSQNDGGSQNPQEPQITTEQKEFNSLMGRINALENLSKTYNEDQYINRVLVYIRSGKYNTQEWSVIGGEPDSEFDAYVLTNQTKTVSDLKQKDNFIIPKTKEKVDFVHFFATLNAVYYSSTYAYHDLAGWGGDLMQLASSIKDTDKTGDMLYSYVKTLFNSNIGAFNDEDVCADLDALNIGLKLKNKEQNLQIINETIKDYYENFTRSNAKQMFISNIFNKTYSTLGEFQDDVYTKVSRNMLLKMWGNKNGFDITQTKNAELLKVCCNVFAEFLYA